MIYETPPQNWKQLQSYVCEILNESGYTAESPKKITTARSELIEVDVYAVNNSVPKQSIVCECKYWDSNIPQSVVHAFRTQINDIGANLGLVISKKGFQAGALSSAKYTNVELFTWNDFETMYESIWYTRYFLAQIYKISDVFIEYNEPINSRVFRKAEALPECLRQAFLDLRKKHFDMFTLCSFLSINYLHSVSGQFDSTLINMPSLLQLPLSNNQRINTLEISSEIKEVNSYKKLLYAINAYVSNAVSEFDEVFGERA